MRQPMLLAGAAALAVLILSSLPAARADAAATTLVEIRSYTLKPGTRARFHRRFVEESLPLLNQAKVQVIAYGPSLHDDLSYVLMRGFSSLEARQQSEDAFYASDAWRNGPRDATLADIDTYSTVVMRVDAATLRGLRATTIGR